MYGNKIIDKKVKEIVHKIRNLFLQQSFSPMPPDSYSVPPSDCQISSPLPQDEPKAEEHALTVQLAIMLDH